MFKWVNVDNTQFDQVSDKAGDKSEWPGLLGEYHIQYQPSLPGSGSLYPYLHSFTCTQCAGPGSCVDARPLRDATTSTQLEHGLFQRSLLVTALRLVLS